MERLWERVLAIGSSALLGVLACASASRPFEIGPGQRGAPGVESLMLLPLNVYAELHTDLQGSTRKIHGAITEYLTGRGKRVVTLALPAARQRWFAIAAHQIGSDEPVPDFAGAARIYVRSLRAHREFDALVMPSLVYRNAKVSGNTAVWDGVKRPIEVLNLPPPRSDTYILQALTVESSYAMDEPFPAVSLHLFIFTVDGTRVFQSLAGLDLIHLADFTSAEQTGFWTKRLIRQRLENEEAIHHGIALAFDPYLPLE